jgi:hypothetical protein
VFRLPLAVLPEGFALAASAETREREWDSGTLGPRVTTDADGRFTFQGLPPGRYALVGKEAGTVQVLGPEFHAAGSSGVRVEARVHRVELRVRAHIGELVPLGIVVRDGVTREPGDPLLVLWMPGRPHARAIDGLTAQLCTEEGREVRYAFASARDPLVEGRLVVPASPWLVRAELQLGPPVEPAVLALDVLADGRPAPGEMRLAVEVAPGIDLTPWATIHGGARELRLPPGRIRVRVEPFNFLVCGNVPLEDFVPQLGPAWAEVELRSGETTPLELTVPPNARFAIELALPRAGTLDEIEAALATMDFREPLRAVLHGARVELVPLDGGRPLVPEFRVELDEHELGEISAPWIAPGRESVAISGLAPGAYRLVATLHDGRRIERDVELAGRHTTTVRLAPE